MTAAEHIADAERLLNKADGYSRGSAGQSGYLAEAQVHATLAVAAATIEANRLRRGPLHNQGFA